MPYNVPNLVYPTQSRSSSSRIPQKGVAAFQLGCDVTLEQLDVRSHANRGGTPMSIAQSANAQDASTASLTKGGHLCPTAQLSRFR